MAEFPDEFPRKMFPKLFRSTKIANFTIDEIKSKDYHGQYKVCKMEKNKLTGTIILSIAIVLCGVMLPVAVKNFRDYDRSVTVKGLCEKEVKADKAIWPLTYKLGSDSLTELTANMDKNEKTIIEFLKKGGIKEDEISINVPVISDKLATEWNSDRKLRYISKCGITVCTKNVDAVTHLSADVSELLKKGIILGTGEYNDTVSATYLFEGLNDIKPAMIHEATANARLAAEQFAADSGSKIGKIKTASQGTFSIENRDANTPQIKTVRVVTSLTYYLNN